MKVKTGQKAPDFSLLDQNKQTHRLSDYLGQWVLLYFYPKDNTPGCTIEACSMQESLTGFSALRAQVFGISTDDSERHKNFAAKYGIKFPLLADINKEVVQKYGVWGEKKVLGRPLSVTSRSSVLIDPRGYIAKTYRKVSPKLHAEQVLNDLSHLQAQSAASAK